MVAGGRLGCGREDLTCPRGASWWCHLRALRLEPCGIGSFRSLLQVSAFPLPPRGLAVPVAGASPYFARCCWAKTPASGSEPQRRHRAAEGSGVNADWGAQQSLPRAGSLPLPGIGPRPGTDSQPPSSRPLADAVPTNASNAGCLCALAVS